MNPGGPKLSDLVRGTSLRGAAPAPLSGALCERAGRALGTLARRRGPGPRTMIVGRSHDAAQLRIRDGLVRGLVLSGHRVLDIGSCPLEVFTFMLGSVAADAGAYVSTSEGAVHSLTFFVGGKALAAEGLAELCALGDDGPHCAGEGSLDVVDPWQTFAARAQTGATE